MGLFRLLGRLVPFLAVFGAGVVVGWWLCARHVRGLVELHRRRVDGTWAPSTRPSRDGGDVYDG